MTAIERAVSAALVPEVRSATVYRSPIDRVTATRQHRRTEGRSTTVVVTIGKPNYKQRIFVKQCKKAGVRFPITKVQLTYWPKKRR